MILKIFLSFIIFFFSFSANAQEKQILTIYSYDSFTSEWGPAPNLTKEFEKTCNCTLKWVGIDSSIGALRRIQLEGENSKADILLGLDSSLISKKNIAGLFEDHQIDTSKINVPNDWKSDIFIPFDYGYFAFIYNSEKLKSPPNSFAKMAQKGKDFKIIIQDPRSSTPGFGLMLWLNAVYGKEAPKIWTSIAPNIVTITKSWGDAYGLFLDGEADMVLSYSTSPAYHKLVENDNRFKAALFNEGHYAQIEVAGILKNSKNKKLANEFLKFLISNEAQRIIPTTNFMYPVIDIELDNSFDGLIKPTKILLLDADIISQNSDIWIKEMFEALD